MALIAAALVVAVAGFAIARSAGDDDESEPSTTTAAPAGRERTPQAKPRGSAKPAPPPPPAIVVRDGKPVGGVRKIAVEHGERVRFTVESDVADEVHVHGYDLTFDVPAGGTAEVDFEADADGLFEVELHEAGAQIVALRVEP
jgi:hypothetical protein